MKIITIIIALSISACSYSQKFSLAFTDRPFAYLGMDNYVSCTIEGLSNKQVVLSSNNGVFENHESGFIYKPERVGDSKIVISKKLNGKIKKVGEYVISARRLPPGVANIGGMHNGTMSKRQLIVQAGIGCSHIWPPNVCLNYTVLGYTITASRGDSILFNKKQEGNYFTDEIRQFCNSLRSKDKLLVYGITYRDNYGEIQKASPIEFDVE